MSGVARTESPAGLEGLHLKSKFPIWEPMNMVDSHHQDEGAAQGSARGGCAAGAPRSRAGVARRSAPRTARQARRRLRSREVRIRQAGSHRRHPVPHGGTRPAPERRGASVGRQEPCIGSAGPQATAHVAHDSRAARKAGYPARAIDSRAGFRLSRAEKAPYCSLALGGKRAGRTRRLAQTCEGANDVSDRAGKRSRRQHCALHYHATTARAARCTICSSFATRFNMLRNIRPLALLAICALAAVAIPAAANLKHWP